MGDQLRELARRVHLDGALKWAYVQGRMCGERAKFATQGRPDASSTILLAGPGRSGTTWLADVICDGTGLQQIYEPLHPRFCPEVRRLTGFDERDPYLRLFYLATDDNNPAWSQFWRAVLTGCVRNYWTDYSRTAWLPDRFLVKSIRAGLMLGYIHDHFHPVIIYLTRHPCAVVYSRLHKVAVPWHADVEDLLRQEPLVEGYLRPWVSQIERERDPLGAHAAWWAVETMVARRELASRTHYALTYEALSLRPEWEIRALQMHLGLDTVQPSTEKLTRPSRMATPGTFNACSRERLREWQHTLSYDEQRRILDWAHRLGIDDYNEQVLPQGFSEAL